MTQPRGFIGIIVILFISGFLVWLALYGAPWIPHLVIVPAASSTPAAP